MSNCRLQIWSLFPNFFKKAKGILSSLPSICLSVRPSVCPLYNLLLNHWTKFNQIWCVSYWQEWGVQRQTFFNPTPRALGRGQKVKYHLISITKSISKIFFTKNFVCVLTNERSKTYQTGFSFCPLGHAPGVGLWGAGVPRGSFFQICHVVYQIKGRGEQNRMQVKFSS